MRARMLCVAVWLCCMAFAPMAWSLAAESSGDASDEEASGPAGPGDVLPAPRDNKQPTESQQVEARRLFQTLTELLQHGEPEGPSSISAKAQHAVPAIARPVQLGNSALITGGYEDLDNRGAQQDGLTHSLDRHESMGASKTPIPRMDAKMNAEAWATDWEVFAAYEDSEKKLPMPLEPEDRTPAVARQAPADNSAAVASGREAFNRDCTSCHDAQRALSRRKSLGDWRTTIRRMASKAGAAIPSSDWDAIAAYLATETNPAPAAGAGGPTAGAEGSEKKAEESSVSAYGVFSPLFRGGTNDSLQNPGFFPELWVGAAWQPKGAVSARVTACISCHNETVSRVEVVEAAMRLDVAKWFQSRNSRVQATIDAGRFIVPFGAFSTQVSPGAFRTVTPPVIFNMGQRVANVGVAVLPMPYADEGANFHASLPVVPDMDLTIDSYLVNGLQGFNFGLDFLQSRDYVDNNSRPSAGGRVTLGNHYIRAGTSITGGQFNVPVAGISPGLNYQIIGFDIAAHYEDIVRVQAEYARRDMDTFSGSFSFPQPFGLDRTSGYYVEGELRVYQKPRISLLARYDGQDHRTIFGDAGHVRRLTAGVNFSLPDGSLLMINYERWLLSAPFPSVDVVGVRWAATF
jgi:mono/diheme cytochrome c family protein